MGCCTCYTHVSGRTVSCQWHGGTREDEVFTAQVAIKELRQELADWEKTLKALQR
jgi:hypothetical protein